MLLALVRMARLLPSRMLGYRWGWNGGVGCMVGCVRCEHTMLVGERFRYAHSIRRSWNSCFSHKAKVIFYAFYAVINNTTEEVVEWLLFCVFGSRHRHPFSHLAEKPLQHIRWRRQASERRTAFYYTSMANGKQKEDTQHTHFALHTNNRDRYKSHLLSPTHAAMHTSLTHTAVTYVYVYKPNGAETNFLTAAGCWMFSFIVCFPLWIIFLCRAEIQSEHVRQWLQNEVIWLCPL